MTLDELMALDKEYYTPSEVADVLGTSNYAITRQAREDRENGVKSFPFPVICIGNRVKIPKRPFLEAMGAVEKKGESA